MLQDTIIIKGIKVSDFPEDKLTVQGIFLHNHNWDIYQALNNTKLRRMEKKEVKKMLDCSDKKRGFIEYYCEYFLCKFGSFFQFIIDKNFLNGYRLP